MKMLPLVFCVMFAFATYAQQLEVDTTYFGKNDNRVTGITESYYYRIDSTYGEIVRTDEFYTGSKKQRYLCEAGKRFHVRPFIAYYDNGTVMATGARFFRGANGLIKMYYPDGKPLAEVNVADFGKVDIREYWDSSGTKIIDNGNGSGKLVFPFAKDDIEGGEGTVASGNKTGKWKGEGLENSTYEETWKNGELIKGESLKNGVKYKYTKLHTTPEPKQGPVNFSRYLAKELTRTRCQVETAGTMYIEFVVDIDGSLSNARIARQLAGACNEEVARIIQIIDKWTPGRQRGLPIKYTATLPVNFKM